MEKLYLKNGNLRKGVREELISDLQHLDNMDIQTYIYMGDNLEATLHLPNRWSNTIKGDNILRYLDKDMKQDFKKIYGINFERFLATNYHVLRQAMREEWERLGI
jgi:hypothetical protein